jgi:hypothetical protein
VVSQRLRNKFGEVFTSKFVGPGPSSSKKKEFTGQRSHKG